MIQKSSLSPWPHFLGHLCPNHFFKFIIYVYFLCVFSFLSIWKLDERVDWSSVSEQHVRHCRGDGQMGESSTFGCSLLAVWLPEALSLITFLGFQTCLRGGGGRVRRSRRWEGHAGGHSCCQFGAGSLLKSPVFLSARSDTWFPNPHLPCETLHWQHTSDSHSPLKIAVGSPPSPLPSLFQTEATFDTIIVVLSLKRSRRRARLASEGKCDAPPLSFFLFMIKPRQERTWRFYCTPNESVPGRVCSLAKW